jgi:hypothetical protein
MEQHVNKIHKKVFPYVCDQCGNNFHSRKYLGDHVAVVHEGKKRAFKSKSLPPEERLKHKKMCNCCGKLFTASSLKKHAERSVSY